jgi:branched-chain amino acid transport system ATP-binding protein
MTSPIPEVHAAREQLLTVSGLRVRYGGIEAVHGVSFEVSSGEVVALIGANGAGKTSTLAAISGLVRPAAGRIRFDGRDITGAASHRIVNAGLIQVPEGREILARMSVQENLQLGQRGGSTDGTELDRTYARFPILGERRRLAAGSLSGGEQQILAIARALLARPRLLLLDEPSLGLAPMMVADVFAILADLKAAGTTMLLVEQNALRALRLADRAYVMDLGQITLSGTGVELLHDEAVARAYLGA